MAGLVLKELQKQLNESIKQVNLVCASKNHEECFKCCADVLEKSGRLLVATDNVDLLKTTMTEVRKSISENGKYSPIRCKDWQISNKGTLRYNTTDCMFWAAVYPARHALGIVIL